MLFLQGARDAWADLDRLQPLCESLGDRATLRLFLDADHAFHVPARSGRSDAALRAGILDASVAWVDATVVNGPSHALT